MDERRASAAPAARLYMLVRLGGLAIFFLGIAIIYTGSGAPGRLATGRRDRRHRRRDRRCSAPRGFSRRRGTRRTASSSEAVLEGPTTRARRGRMGRSARRQAGPHAGASGAERANAKRWPRRSPTNGGAAEDHRPARHAADRYRQCRDRSGCAGLRAFAAGLARYAEADLACYRAEGPPPLIERQAPSWDPLLAWARRRCESISRSRRA